MLNLKVIARLIVATMLSLLVVGSAFAGVSDTCYATSAGPIVDMHEKPHTASTVVNTLSIHETHLVVGARKIPSELEPEGAHVLWLLLKPLDGSASGWVMYPQVIVFGDCSKYGI